MQTAITINKTDLDAVVENAEESNKEIINDMIDPTPAIILDDTLNLDRQSEYDSNDLEITFDLSNQVQEKLDNLLSLMKENTCPSIDISMIEKPAEGIPNNPLSSEKSDTKTENIYIGDNYLDNIQFFPKPSTNDRKDFEIKVGGDSLIVYNSPMLTTVNISRKNLKNVLNNILEDLNANIEKISKRIVDKKRLEEKLENSKNLLIK